MPYPTLASLPDWVKEMPKHAQEIYQAAFNSALKQYDGDESKAAATAITAVKKGGYQKQGEEWVKMSLETGELKDVEIFAVGEWNGKKYTENDLLDIVNNFNVLRDVVKPYLKLGHDPDQKLLQTDGYPAAGWVTNLKKKGPKIFADITGIPKKICDLIGAGGYKRVSCELYINFRDHAKNVYSKVLRAVALLGADTPAVGILDDLLAQYAIAHDDGGMNKEREEVLFEIQQGGEIVSGKQKEKEEKQMMTIDKLPEKIKGMQGNKKDAFIKKYNDMKGEGKADDECLKGAMGVVDKLTEDENQEIENHKREEAKKMDKEQIEKLTKENDDYKKQLDDIKKKEKEKSIDDFAEKMLKEEKITPKQAPFMKLVLNGLNESEVVTFVEGEKKEQMSIVEAFKKLMAANAKGSLLSEISGVEGFTTLEQAIDAEMKADKKLNYSQATKAAARKFPALVLAPKSND